MHRPFDVAQRRASRTNGRLAASVAPIVMALFALSISHVDHRTVVSMVVVCVAAITYVGYGKAIMMGQPAFWTGWPPLSP
jgi:lipopolysaccharide export LptBFGC system permease protein LptF